MKKQLQAVILIVLISLSIWRGYASAHEVYVLPEEGIQQDLSQNSPSPFEALEEGGALIKFGIAGTAFALSILLVFFLGRWKRLQDLVSPFLAYLKKFAPLIARVFLGVGIIFGAVNNAIFGPELPLSLLPFPVFMKALLVVVGINILVGLFTRFFSFILLIIFSYLLFLEPQFTLSYLSYLGEIFLLLAFGSQFLALDRAFFSFKPKAKELEEKYGPVILRLGLSLALLWAAIDVKFFHAQLSLDVVQRYGLASYFPFDPLFIVLGAGITEIVIALLFMFGILIRFNTIVFISFITVSLFFFGETVWPHLILYGISLAIAFFGYDKYTLQARLFRDEKAVF